MPRKDITPPAVAFTGSSGTGKTTLIEALVAVFVKRGRRVGAMKHDAHRFTIDKPGKDSARFTAAGAEVMVLVSDKTVAEVRQTRGPADPRALLGERFAGLDLVLVEGYKTSDLPKIAVHRTAADPEIPSLDDPNLMAVVTDSNLSINVPVLPLGDPEAVADFIEERVL